MSLLLLCAFLHILRSCGLQYGLWTSEEKLWTIYWVNSKLMSPFNPPASSFLPRSWLVINKREAPAGPLRQVRFHGQLLKALLSWTRCCRVWKGSKLKTGWSECEIQLQTSQSALRLGSRICRETSLIRKPYSRLQGENDSTTGIILLCVDACKSEFDRQCELISP